MKEWYTQEEDVLTYAMFGQVATKFFEKRAAGALGADAEGTYTPEVVVTPV